ncbi:unnamed protein product [Anisakis simplex]|uniref:Transposase_23 domain-containing protein n=1 Tax=Anisakis simplex TaxID=6269 RepID=A0A0M3K2U8_ANISI|nr:unnamed protein product [Anisakis simplex]
MGKALYPLQAEITAFGDRLEKIEHHLKLIEDHLVNSPKETTPAKSTKACSYASVASSSSSPDPVAIAIHVKAIEEDRINQSRQKCLLIHNIPEQNSDTATEKFDSTIANDLVISASVKRNSVKKVFRIGRKVSDRSRPLKIEADSLDTSKTLVRHFGKFRNTREGLKDCKVRLDYSEPILEIYRNVWKTALERNTKEGVMRWIVSDDVKLVEITQNRQPYETRRGTPKSN